jgi:hypothetical protein
MISCNSLYEKVPCMFNLCNNIISFKLLLAFKYQKCAILDKQTN